jgi:hypothetical protein
MFSSHAWNQHPDVRPDVRTERQSTPSLGTPPLASSSRVGIQDIMGSTPQGLGLVIEPESQQESKKRSMEDMIKSPDESDGEEEGSDDETNSPKRLKRSE